MTIHLPPDLERPLTEEARKKGTTAELLAIDSLRRLFPQDQGEGAAAQPKTLLDLLGDSVGAVAGSGEAWSENCGERFTDGLVEKHRREGR